MSPQAWLPESGPNTRTPRARSKPRFAWVAGCAHICWFIAGATDSGAALARHNVVNKSSAWP